MQVTGGDTNVTTYFALRLSADGTAATGLTLIDFDLQYVRSGAAPSAKVDASALAATDSTHSDNGVFEIDSTDQPGLYRVDWPDAAFAAGVREVILTVKIATAFTEYLAVGIDPPVDVTKVAGTSQTAGDLAALVVTADAAIDVAVDDLANGTDGLGALKTLIDTVNTDLANGTDGLGALKTLIDTVNTDLANGTDGLGALKTLIDAVKSETVLILADTDDIGVAGAGLTAINLPNQTMDIIGNITGNLSGSVGSVTGAVGSVTGAVGSVAGNVDGNVTGSVGSNLELGPAEVNAQCDTALTDIKLHKLLAATVAGSDVEDDSVIAQLVSKSGIADWDDFDNATDSLQAIRDNQAAGTGLTALATGTAQAGTNSTIRLADASTFPDDTFVGCVINLITGTGAGQSRVITAYALTNDVATVSPDWADNPISGTTYEIIQGSSNLQTVVSTVQTAGDLAALVVTADAAIDVAVDDLANGTDGLGALKTLIDTVNSDLANGTDGLGALKALIDTSDTVVDAIKAVTDLLPNSGALSDLATIVTDLANGTDGLGALKALIDTVNTDLANGTDGLGALKALIDTSDTVVDAIKVVTDKFAFTVTNIVDSNPLRINGNANAASALQESASTIKEGTAKAGTLTVGTMSTTLTEADDVFNGRVLIFKADTATAALRLQATDITDYANTNGVLSFTDVTTAPANNETFIIV